MIYRTVSLYDLIKQEIGKDEIKKILSDFSCPINKDVEYFIQSKAYDFERVRLSRTYLVYALIDEQAVLVAMYSLGHKHVEIGTDLNVDMKKKIFGTTYPLGKSINTILIGQLSKNFKNGNNKYITGKLLMNLVFARIKEIDTLIPSVVIHVDCKDDANLRKYYEKSGFMLFKKQGDMLVYLMPTSNIFDLTIA